MRAVDTNIIVRFLTDDDPQQSKTARSLIEAGDIFIPVTVILESEWVLRSAYGYPAVRIAEAFRGLAGLFGVTMENSAQLAQALDWMAGGMDFADALHLAKAEGCDAFLSFDRRLARVAKGRSPVTVREP